MLMVPCSVPAVQRTDWKKSLRSWRSERGRSLPMNGANVFRNQEGVHEQLMDLIEEYQDFYFVFPRFAIALNFAFAANLLNRPVPPGTRRRPPLRAGPGHRFS